MIFCLNIKNLLATLVDKHLNSIDDESLSVILYELFSLDEQWASKEDKDDKTFHQSQETLSQEIDSYRKFYDICSDVLNLNEKDPQSAKKFYLIYITCLLCQKPM